MLGKKPVKSGSIPAVVIILRTDFASQIRSSKPRPSLSFSSEAKNLEGRGAVKYLGRRQNSISMYEQCLYPKKYLKLLQYRENCDILLCM